MVWDGVALRDCVCVGVDDTVGDIEPVPLCVEVALGLRVWVGDAETDWLGV